MLPTTRSMRQAAARRAELDRGLKFAVYFVKHPGGSGATNSSVVVPERLRLDGGCRAIVLQSRARRGVAATVSSVVTKFAT